MCDLGEENRSRQIFSSFKEGAWDATHMSEDEEYEGDGAVEQNMGIKISMILVWTNLETVQHT